MRLVCRKMADRDALEALSSKELHDRALDHAKRHLDVKFFWQLFRAMPAAEAAVGRQAEAEDDVMSLYGHINDLTDSGEGEVADALRPLFIEYLATRD